MKYWITTILLLAVSNAYSDANEGEFLGYKIGNIYKVTKNTKIAGGFYNALGYKTIIAESPIAPNDIQQVHLVLCPTSYTIVNITGLSTFSDEGPAVSQVYKYLDLLKAKYPNWGTKLSYHTSEFSLHSNNYLINLDYWGYNSDLDWREKNDAWNFRLFFRNADNSYQGNEIKKRCEDEINQLKLDEHDTSGL